MPLEIFIASTLWRLTTSRHGLVLESGMEFLFPSRYWLQITFCLTPTKKLFAKESYDFLILLDSPEDRGSGKIFAQEKSNNQCRNDNKMHALRNAYI